MLYILQQNRVAERANRTIIEYTRTILQVQKLGKKFWGEAITIATYLKNQSLAKSTEENKIPYEV